MTFHACEVRDSREAEVAVPIGKGRTNVSFSTCWKMCFYRFVWQAWHFVTFHVCEMQDCREAEVAVPTGKVAQTCLFPRVRRCGHVVLRGRRGTL